MELSKTWPVRLSQGNVDYKSLYLMHHIYTMGENLKCGHRNMWLKSSILQRHDIILVILTQKHTEMDCSEVKRSP